MPIKIHTYETGPVDTNGYLLYEEETNTSVIIDAPLDMVLKLCSQLSDYNSFPSALLLTHSHWDHIGDAQKLQLLYPNMKTYIHNLDSYRLIEPMKHTIWELPFDIPPVTKFDLIEDGDELSFGNINLKLMHTPGHTEGSICFYDNERKILFGGDVLFQNSIGRTDLPGGDYDTLINSIKDKLLKLEDKVLVLSGHGDRTTIGIERESNPFLK
ncbi:MAG: MBL fold metallo-hydrolase [Chlorobiota bacterium]|jgi:glyoxylase-like metal-dependent hydrolase (beta-lactamase superfamily II)|nr:MBL fold metallo-hydrolase [Chlorobiota bacterium]QQS66174.1 MAG: MBL fold metallo-hydrolase [Chlorobiota bacterium]